MSKYNNVNPGQYKTAGRERPGDGLLQENEKRELRNRQAELKRRANRRGVPGQTSATAKGSRGTPSRRTNQDGPALVRAAEMVGRAAGTLQRPITAASPHLTNAPGPAAPTVVNKQNLAGSGAKPRRSAASANVATEGNTPSGVPGRPRAKVKGGPAPRAGARTRR